jgi:hypothetical protein
MMKRFLVIPLLFLLNACQPPEPPTVQTLRTQATYCAYSSGMTKTKLDIKFDFTGWVTNYNLYWTPSLIAGNVPTKLEDFSAAQIQKVVVSQFGTNTDINLPRSGSGTITTNFFLTANADGTVKVAATGTGDSGRVWIQAFNNTLASQILQSQSVTADSSTASCDPTENILK